MTRSSILIILLSAIIWFALFAYGDLFDQNETGARLIIGLTGFIMSFSALQVGRHLYGEKAGLYAFLMCISCLLVLLLGNYLTMDVLPGAFVFLGTGCFLIAQSMRRDVTHVRRWMITGWIALAMAILTEGPVAVLLPAVAFAAYSLWQCDWQFWRQSHLVKGVLLLLMVAAPWGIVISNASSDFSSVAFIHDNLLRFSSDHQYQPVNFHYYLPIVILGVGPWIWTSFGVLFKPDFKWQTGSPGSFHPERFMWVFTIVALVGFVIWQSTRTANIVSLLCVLAVLSGQRLAARSVA